MREKFRVDEDGVLRPVLDDQGREIPDSTPMAPPVGYRRHVPLHERIRAMVQHEYMKARELEEVETPEEADDFLVGDDVDPREARFALQPGHEHDWEENYEPPKDFKDMRQRLVDAGWTPPEKDVEGQEKSAVKQSKSEEKSISLDRDVKNQNRKDPRSGSGSKDLESE